MPPPRPVLGALTVLVMALAGCSSGGLEQRATATASRTAVVDASYTAAITGRTSHVMVPSGRVDLTVTTPRTRLAAQLVSRAAPLRAAKGTALVGVRWQLERSVYPHYSEAGAPSASDVFGAPRAVRLYVVAGGARREIPHVSNLVVPVGRPSTAVWVAVPTTAAALRVQIDYRGLTQTVDARSGKVLDAAAAAPLYATLPRAGYATCRVATLGRDACGAFPVVGYPYVDAAGWAPRGRTWAILELQLQQTATNRAGDVTIAGSRAAATVTAGQEQYTAFAVPAGRSTWPLGGTVTLDGSSTPAVSGTVHRTQS